MDDAKLRCAQAALGHVPEDYRTIDAESLARQAQGHLSHEGMFMAWAWGQDEDRGCFLDFLCEHRLPGMYAERFYVDGTSESIPTPESSHQVTGDPGEDAEITRKFFERNRDVYADLRGRGLLPAGDLRTQIDELLLSGGDADSQEE